MLAFTKFLTGATGLALVVGIAAPAAAQYPYGYANPVGQVFNQVLGGGATGADRYAVDRCARAAEDQVARSTYGNFRYSGYGYANAGARVVAITRVEQRSNGLRVRGVVDAAAMGRQYDFRCNIDYRGYVRDVDIHRRDAYYRGY